MIRFLINERIHDIKAGVFAFVLNYIEADKHAVRKEALGVTDWQVYFRDYT